MPAPAPKTLPQIAPPVPVDSAGNAVWQYNAENDTVTLPYWYWEKVFDYIADTQAVLRAVTQQ